MACCIFCFKVSASREPFRTRKKGRTENAPSGPWDMPEYLVYLPITRAICTMVTAT